ncbi:prepilin-type N-terminal cleavage/methylation domain-containing protein [Rummeliibacillus sp. BSL5]
MKLKMKKAIKNEKGVTLIELLAVIVIIAIIALIAVPAIGNIIQNSKDKSILADTQTVLAGAKIAIAEGVCTTSEDKASITCDKATLQPYVEGVTLATDDKVVKTVSSSSYSIQYDALKNIKSSKFSNGITGTPKNIITDTVLAQNMGNK